MIMAPIPLLNHGYVKLVSYTQPAERDSDPSWSADLEIVRAARVSHNADWRAGKDEGSDEKLINRLRARNHTTPFEALTFSFEVQAPIFVFRQWHRHRTQSYNEVSARYTELPDLFYVPAPDQVRAQSKTEKQGRGDELPDSIVQDYLDNLNHHNGLAYGRYKRALAHGVSRELARLFLGVNVYSRMYASANLMNWFRFLDLRKDFHAQYEVRVYADAMTLLLSEVAPIAMGAFARYKHVMVDVEAEREKHSKDGGL